MTTPEKSVEDIVAEFSKLTEETFFVVNDFSDTSQLKDTLWAEEYWPDSQVELDVDKVKAWLIQTLQALDAEYQLQLKAERQKRGEMLEHIRSDISARNLILDELRKGNDMGAGDIECQTDYALSAKIVLEELLEALTQPNNPK